MIFEYTLTITAAQTEAVPASQVMKLTKGIVHKLEIVGDGGEHNLVFVVIRRGLHQVWPTNPDGQLHPGFFPISYPVWQPLDEAPFEMVVEGWAPDTTYDHTVTVRLGIQHGEVLEPGREAIGVLGRLRDLFFGGR